MLSVPASPVERVNPELGRTWRLLRDVAPRIPPGATFTVRAASAEVEMEAFMVAVGLIPHAQALPSSYYGVPQPRAGGEAEWVVVVGEASLSPEGVEVVSRSENGLLLRRRPHP